MRQNDAILVIHSIELVRLWTTVKGVRFLRWNATQPVMMAILRSCYHQLLSHVGIKKIVLSYGNPSFRRDLRLRRHSICQVIRCGIGIKKETSPSRY